MSPKYPPLSLMGLPSELRSMIFAYVLPTDHLNCSIVIDNYKPRVSHDYHSASNTIKQLEKREWHLDLLRVNRTCYSEAIHMIYNRMVSIDISEEAFQHPKNQIRSIEDLEKTEEKILAWAWGPLKPGLQFSLLRELQIVIEPINAPGYWYCLQSLLSKFCEERLDDGSHLKRLTIKIMDTMRSVIDPVMYGSVEDRAVREYTVPARFEDYEATLTVIKRVIQSAKRCDIYLPYWMETHQNKDWMIKQWGSHIGTKIYFMAFPTWADEGFDSHRLIDGVAGPKWSFWSEFDQKYHCPWDLPKENEYPEGLSRTDFPCLADLESGSEECGLTVMLRRFRIREENYIAMLHSRG